MRAIRRQWQRGAAAVEFALVMTPLLLLALGGIDFGHYFYVREIVVNAAREGARAGAIVPNALSQPAVANATAVATAQAYLTSVGLTAAATVDNCTPSPAPPVPYVCVQVLYPAASITGFLSALMPANAMGQAAMRLEP